jgi:hypothetical protein
MKQPVMVRMSPEERTQGEAQAAKLNLNLSEYIRLIITLDASTEIIKRLKEELK